MNTNASLADLRRNYALESLTESDVASNPFVQFHQWFQEALQAQILEPNAMTLATANEQGRPSARTVLLKGFDEAGFVFFTNYESRKGQELTANPQAALLFVWLELERQILIEGSVEKVPTAESEAYFAVRPRGSRLGAWASPQSRVIDGRAVLEQNMRDLENLYPDDAEVPMPAFWGGFRVLPVAFEFWQGRESRLHDRIRYTRSGADWQIERLAP